MLAWLQMQSTETLTLPHPTRRGLMSSRDSPPPTEPNQLLSGSKRVRALLEATGLSSAEAARALDVDERKLLDWCQSDLNLPPRWVLMSLQRLVKLRQRLKPRR